MSIPAVSVKGGAYTLVWAAEQITITVDRIRDKQDNVWGEITVTTSLPGYNSHLHRATMNLSATQTRGIMARRLELECPVPEITWLHIIEQLCIKVIDLHRQGEPVYQLGKDYEPTEERFRLWPLLKENQPTIIFGQGGSGKSLLGTYLSTLVSEGEIDNGFRPIAGNALYLDYESDRDELEDRVRNLRKALGLEGPSNIFYRFCWQPIAADAAEIHKQIAEYDIQLIIVDSAGPACGGEPENAGVAIEYFRTLRSFRRTSLSITHLSKGEELKKYPMPFGSVYWLNHARSLFFCKAPSDREEGALSIGLFHRKVNRGELLKPLGLRFEFENDRISVTREDIRKVPELAAGLPLKERIVAMFRETPKLKAQDMAEFLEVKRNTVDVALQRYKGKLFISLGEGEWGLLTHLTKE